MSDATEAHLLALTSQLPDDLAVPVVAFPNGAPVIIGAGRHGHIGKAVDAVARYRDQCNVYIGVYAVELDRLRRLHKKGRRGGDDDVAAVVAVIVDVDIAGPNHKSEKDYPHDLDEAHAVVDGVGPEPTFTLHTGGGIGAWWVLADPLFIDSADDRAQAGVVGNICGLDVLTDPSIPLTAGGGTEDVVIALRRSDLVLHTSPVSMFTQRDASLGPSEVRVICSQYASFSSDRFESAVVVISGTGLAAPTIP